jgi:myo-inositol-1(or 4)-monophosphatase
VAWHRRFGSAALDLAWVAGRAASTAMGRGPQYWDIAAGSLLGREAGGFVTDFRVGADSALETGQVLAANDQIHSKLHKLVAGSLRG